MMKLDIRSKLLLLTLVPMLLIAALSIGRVVYEFSVQKNLQETKHRITQANAISDIIHFMQIERGLSAGFAANQKRTDNGALISARGELDQAFEYAMNNGYLKSDADRGLIKEITEIRKAIDASELPVSLIRDNYTRYISTLLDFVKGMPVKIEDREDRNYIQAYSYLASAKEQLGKIRAALHEVFVLKNLSQENMMQVKEYLNIYDAATGRFKKTLDEDQGFLIFYKKNIKNKDIEEMFGIIQATLKIGDAKEPSVEPLYWFETATRAIDVFKLIEERLFSDVNDSIDKKIKNAEKNIWLIIVSLLSLLGILMFFLRTTAKKILSSTYMLNEEFENSLLLLKQYKATVDESFVVSKTDAKGIIRYANNAFCKISGYTRDELVGKPHSIIRHPDMPKETFKEMWHTIEHLKKPWVGEIKNRSKDGSAYWMKAFIHPITNINGNVVEYIGMRTDITSLQKEKEYIRDTLGITAADFEEARHLAKVYENAIYATWSVVRTDTNNIIVHMNDTFERLSGYTKEELIGKNCSELRHPKHIRNNDCEEIKKRLADKEIVRMQFENIAKDKSSCYMDTTIVPIINTQGDVIEHLHLMGDITELIKLHVEIEKTQQDIIFRMGEIGESRSKETGNHVRRVSKYSKLLALKAGFDEKEAQLIADASPMHDIGKVAVPDDILLKPGPLDDTEWEIMQSHCIIGSKVLSGSSRPLLNAAAIIAGEHHEKYDGSGYPEGKAGEDIHIYGRIVAIADVFDALGSDRVYKKAWELPKILEFFEAQKGLHFDPRLAELFLENINEFLDIKEKYKDRV